MRHDGRHKQEEKVKPASGLSYVGGKVLWAVITFIVLSLLIFLLLSAADASAASYGDINGDGRIDVRDVVLVTRHTLGMELIPEIKRPYADVNGDGLVNVQDITLIMQKALGLIDRFPAAARPGSELIQDFITADGITPGNKLVIVVLNVSDPENYEVTVGDTLLNYRESVGGFTGEVDTDSADIRQTEVTRK